MVERALNGDPQLHSPNPLIPKAAGGRYMILNVWRNIAATGPVPPHPVPVPTAAWAMM